MNNDKLNFLFCLGIDIFIKNMTKKIPFDDIRYSFLQLDAYFLDEQIILNLLKYLPSKDEMEKLQAYELASLEEVEKLGIPEKFCLQVNKKREKKIGLWLHEN